MPLTTTHATTFALGLAAGLALAGAALAAGGGATVTHLADAERRGPGNGNAEIATLARGQEAFIGRLTMAAGGAVGEHQDATEEYIHVLSGDGTLTIDGVAHELTAGSTAFMPAGATVTYQNGAQELVALQVFAGPESADKYQKWEILTD